MATCPECHETIIELKGETYREDAFIQGRVLIFLNMEVWICGCGYSPVYRNIKQLARLIHENPADNMFRWDEKDLSWEVES